MIKNKKDLSEDFQKKIKSADAWNKKSIYEITDEDKDTFSYSGFEEKQEFVYLGQIALNNGCDLFVFENELYLADSHDSDDFLSDSYFEDCDYCYNTKKL